MSGHSKWSTIKRSKGAADVKRGMVFTKLANVIALSARAGNSGDPNSNPRLRSALEDAKKVNLPKENVQRAIDRGLGKLSGQSIEEVIYEGFGPGKVAFYLEGVTDNKLRTNSEIKNLFEKAGGNLGGLGSVAYLFDKKGEIKVQSSKIKNQSEEEETLILIDLGAGDIESFMEDGVRKYFVYTEPTLVGEVSTKITQFGFEVEKTGMIMKPNMIINISDPETAKKVMELTKKLEDHDDIHKVYANFDIPEELI